VQVPVAAYVFPGYGTFGYVKGTSSPASPSLRKTFRAFFSSTVRGRAFSAAFPSIVAECYSYTKEERQVQSIPDYLPRTEPALTVLR
jgi:O-acetyl-ADP-ribose deacetylase (regulator of RNase III)